MENEEDRMEDRKKRAGKLLAILGSPHAEGSAAAMLDCAVKAARLAGWETDVVRLYEQNIGWCRGCRACMESHRCVMEDDAAGIERLLAECDAVVLAAPVYWANVPGAVKNLFDRLLGVAMEDTDTFPKPRLSPGQRYLLLTACNTPAPFSWLVGQTGGAFRAMEEFFGASGMKRMKPWFSGRVAFSGTKGRQGHPPRRVTRRIERYFR